MRTFIDKALKLAAQRFFTEREGDRPKFPNVLILFTDGRTNENSKPFSEIIPLLNVRFKLRPLYCSFTFIITCNEEVKLSIEQMIL